jgi:hypothetical protein
MDSTITLSVRMKLSGADESLDRGEHAARDAAERRPHREGEEFHVARVDAHGARRELVFADRLPCAADARVLQAQVQDHDQHQHTSRK